MPGKEAETEDCPLIQLIKEGQYCQTSKQRKARLLLLPFERFLKIFTV